MTSRHLRGAVTSPSVLLKSRPRISCTWGTFPVDRPHEAGAVSAFGPESPHGRRRPGREPRVGFVLRTEWEGGGAGFGLSHT